MKKSGWGQRLKELRGRLRQDVFAEMVGVSRSIWIDYEQETRPPRIDTLMMAAELSGRSVHWIVTGEELKTEKVAILDLEILADSIETAMMSAEAMKLRGKSHSPQQVAAHAKALYEIAVKERIDRIISPSTNAVTETLEASNDTRDENGDHEVHRRSRAGKR